MRVGLATLILLAPAVAAAADPVERLFSSPHLATLRPEQPLSYVHLRSSRLEGVPADLDEVIRVERGADGAHVLVTMDADGTPRPTPFRGMTGNPVLMVFLASVVSAISDATGGSPFYLRNRIEETMRERIEEAPATVELGGSEIDAHSIRVRPFAGDPHAEELGPFAGLELSFLLAEAAPGSFLSLAASAGEDAADYFEEIRLDEAL